MGVSTGLENRAAPRRSSPGRVITIVPVVDGTKNFLGHAQNIGRSGMLIHTYMPIDEGDELALEFTLPDTESIVKCRARVIWSGCFKRGGANACRGGLEFIDLGSQFQVMIDEWTKGK